MPSGARRGRRRGPTAIGIAVRSAEEPTTRTTKQDFIGAAKAPREL